MKQICYFFFAVLIFLGCKTHTDFPQTISLEGNWQFRNTKDTNWYPATVPGSVHTDLLDNALIKDPFIGDNEIHLQWISKSDWEYRTQFSIDKELLKKKNLKLTFEGLDTYASIFLNDSLILETNNAFRNYKIDVKPFLKSQNEIRVLFEDTYEHELIAASKLPYTLPEGPRVFTRKAQFQYGWDWGPKLNTSGIWRPITLTVWNDYKIKNIFVKQKSLNANKAELEIQLEEFKELNAPLTYNVYVNDSLQKSFSEVPNKSNAFLPFEIRNPKLWWPHNLGAPNLYEISIVVQNGQTILDSISTKIGLRTVELITKKDSIGEAFYFKVNGLPVYAKGANYIPQHSFQNKVSFFNYNQLLDDVVQANMNMLRVWGGGIYEEDEFYELCDEKGIMVWQDFMFACAMYSGDETFLENVQQEASQNVKRLRNHPSLVLWCGNNESSEGWHRWGWQENRSDSEKHQIWGNYLKLFDSILPNIVKKFSDTPYWETSPKFGRGNPKYQTYGDAHDWWVWHDGYPFEHYENKVPRFMSEFGFQSFPSFETIRFINQSNTIKLDLDGFKNHQKHVRGFELIREYMKRDFPVPKTPEQYVYVSQLLQAYGIVKGIEAQRRSRPYCMGSLFWQLNDCWPAISWSSIDFSGNWKALHYKTKKTFDNVLVTSELNENKLAVYLVNDNLEPINDSLKLTLTTFNGDVIWQNSKSFSIKGSSSQKAAQIELLENNLNESFLIVEFNSIKKPIYFVKPKDLKLNKEPITKKIYKTENGYKIELSSTTLQKDVFLFSSIPGRFSDNFFDLLPNKTKVVLMESNYEALNDLKIITLNQIN